MEIILYRMDLRTIYKICTQNLLFICVPLSEPSKWYRKRNRETGTSIILYDEQKNKENVWVRSQNEKMKDWKIGARVRERKRYMVNKWKWKKNEHTGTQTLLFSKVFFPFDFTRHFNSPHLLIFFFPINYYFG